MNISDFSIEDFVLDASFRSWVLSPTPALNAEWDRYIAEYPFKVEEIATARKMLLNMTQKVAHISEEEIADLWEEIDQELNADMDSETPSHHLNKRSVPLNSASVIAQYDMTKVKKTWPQWQRVAAILLCCFGLSLLFNFFGMQEVPIENVTLVYTEFNTPPGVKSSISLSDGSIVKLNSGSKIRYVKDFTAGKREVFLEGEAFFDVAKDANRPFTVHTGKTSTTALGTSFNIRSYEGEAREVSLLTGKVVVIDSTLKKKVFLLSGQGVEVNPQEKKMDEFRFDEEAVTAWMNKKIIFEKTPIDEMVRTLENWYGVKIHIGKKPGESLLVSGVFRNETLSNILQGLSYTARFEYQIKDSSVKIDFQ
ncbi:FecR family protein [Echinicola sediminis]